MKIIALIILIVLAAEFYKSEAETVPAPDKDAVILVHGLVRTKRSMKKMKKHLEKEGFSVYVADYPSRMTNIESLTSEYITPFINKVTAKESGDIHFVTHSLGGILLRQHLKTNSTERLGRMVMLAPPNKGSEVVDRLGDLKLFKAINGPAGLQLSTDSKSKPNILPEPSIETGVIAGTKTINLILSTYIPGPNDGKVSVESTRLSNMKDFKSVPVSHPMIMKNKDVLKMTSSFLKTGSFDEEKEAVNDNREERKNSRSSQLQLSQASITN